MPRHPCRLATSLADVFGILAALSCAGLWAGSDSASWASLAAERGAVFATFAVAWLLIARRLGAYGVAPGRNLQLSLRRTMEAWAATWGIAGLLVVSTVDPAALDVWLVLLAGAGALAFVRLAFSFGPLGDATDRLRAVVVGACPSARALTSMGDADESVELVGFLPFAGEDPTEMPHLTRLGDASELADTVRRHDVDLVFVSPSDDARTGDVHRVIDTCERLGVQTQYFPSFLDAEDVRVGIAWSANRPGLHVDSIRENTAAALGKRAVDVLGAAIGILALLPVFVVCAIAVKVSSRGPVLFRQVRVGKSGRLFQCFKFRTMHVGADAKREQLRAASLQDGPAFKMGDDPRVTPLGRVLRKFSVDELPQLFNVLLGDMSLVGPRPPIPSEVEQYTWWQRRRISIKPGLTCVWQVYGRNRVSFKRWVEMDLYYIDNWSLWLDLKLIAHTVRVVLRGTGM